MFLRKLLQQEPEYNASNLLQNISKSLPINKASHPRRLELFIFKVLITCHLVYLKLIAGSGTYE